MFGLHRFKLHRYLIRGTVKTAWTRQVFGLDRCLVYIGSNYRYLIDRTVKSVWTRQVFGLDWFYCIWYYLAIYSCKMSL